MANTTLYCSRTDLEDRLTCAGVEYVADDNQTDDVTEDEKVAAIDTAIDYAGGQIDGALCQWLDTVPLTQDDQNRNQTLKNLAVDLAAERVSERGGGEIPTGFTDAANRAREMLTRYFDGDARPPNVDYPIDSFTTELKQVSSPISVNHVPVFPYPRVSFTRRRF